MGIKEWCVRNESEGRYDYNLLYVYMKFLKIR